MTDIRKQTLDAIVKDGKITGFKIDGFDNGRMDGYGYHLAVSDISISSIEGEDAPDVFRVKEHRYWEMHREANEFRKEYIVLGEQRAIQKAYQLALEYANDALESRNQHIEWMKIGGRAILVDNAEDKLTRQ